MPKTISAFPFEMIEHRFQLDSYWFGATWCPAVDRNKDGGYQIRVRISQTTRGLDTTTKWDLFETAADGTITAAPYGYAKDYKPGRITGLDEAVAKYADPDPTALRLNFGGGF